MAAGRRRDGRPIWVGDGAATPLNRVDLKGTAASGYDEAWLQRLIHAQSSVLPIGQLEPSFGQPTSVCRELPLAFGAGRTGALDNVLVTNTGGLVLVEAKLWRNPEARRKVVAQAMEYAAAIFRFSYEEFEIAVLTARKSAGESELSLFELAGLQGELDEAAFIDAVTRNLSVGRAIVTVVGDGIREDILPLAELLQAHAGQRFTFALVELAIYEAPNGRVVVPSVLAQTTLIERGVVSIREMGSATHQILIEPPAMSARTAAKPARAISIGEDEFYELLDQREAGLSSKLRAFLDQVDELGIFVDRQSGLNLKHDSLEGQPLNLATIRKDGFVDTGPATWWGRTEQGRRYNVALAQAIEGSVTEMKSGAESALRTRLGKTPRLSDLIPEHTENWLAAMREYIAELTSE